MLMFHTSRWSHCKVFYLPPEFASSSRISVNFAIIPLTSHLSSAHAYLVEAAMEEFFDFIFFKCDSLELSFKIMVEERQCFSRVCEENRQKWRRAEANSPSIHPSIFVFCFSPGDVKSQATSLKCFHIVFYIPLTTNSCWSYLISRSCSF